MSDEGDDQIERIARVCHEANRAWCEASGDGSQVPWDEAPEWQKASARDGVVQAMEGASPKELHDSWCEFKRQDGWVYGERKDAEAKTHPCLIEYVQLPSEQRRKDHLFHSIVHALIAPIKVR